MQMDIYKPTYVINSDNLIYQIVKVEQMGAEEIAYCYHLELVAGHDYINPDYSNAQGFVNDPERFISNVQWETITVYPLSESLGERLEEEDFKVINIADYKIHTVKEEE